MSLFFPLGFSRKYGVDILGRGGSSHRSTGLRQRMPGLKNELQFDFRATHFHVQSVMVFLVAPSLDVLCKTLIPTVYWVRQVMITYLGTYPGSIHSNKGPRRWSLLEVQGHRSEPTIPADFPQQHRQHVCVVPLVYFD